MNIEISFSVASSGIFGTYRDHDNDVVDDKILINMMITIKMMMMNVTMMIMRYYLIEVGVDGEYGYITFWELRDDDYDDDHD